MGRRDALLYTTALYDDYVENDIPIGEIMRDAAASSAAEALA